MGRARHRRRRWDFEVGVVKGIRNYWVKEEIAHAEVANPPSLLTSPTQEELRRAPEAGWGGGYWLFWIGYWFVGVGIPHSRDTLSRALFMVGSQEAEMMIKNDFRVLSTVA